MANWTNYWQKTTMQDEQARPVAALLDHSASNLFRLRGVDRGDRIYVISCHGGCFYVLGRLIVGSLVDERQAAKALGYQPWTAADHALAEAGTETYMRFDASIPIDQVRGLEFISGGGIVFPKFTPSGLPDRQTFRGVREISATTAGLFDQALGL